VYFFCKSLKEKEKKIDAVLKRYGLTPTNKNAKSNPLARRFHELKHEVQQLGNNAMYFNHKTQIDTIFNMSVLQINLIYLFFFFYQIPNAGFFLKIGITHLGISC